MLLTLRGESLFGARQGEFIHFNYQYVDQGGPSKSNKLDEADEFNYISVIIDDFGNFEWLEPTESRTGILTTKHLFAWCKARGGVV